MVEHKERPGKKDLIKILISVERETQKGILIGKARPAVWPLPPCPLPPCPLLPCPLPVFDLALRPLSAPHAAPATAQFALPAPQPSHHLLDRCDLFSPPGRASAWVRPKRCRNRSTAAVRQ